MLLGPHSEGFHGFRLDHNVGLVTLEKTDFATCAISNGQCSAFPGRKLPVELPWGFGDGQSLIPGWLPLKS